jgi:radical SAM superfamily enzyme YgiQ (UPF0313 family)
VAVTPVFAVNCYNDLRPPLALGMIVANLRQRHPEVAALLDLTPGYIGTAAGLIARMTRHGPGVVLFSDYVWNIDDHLELSAEIKQRWPESIIIHGGPSVPRHPTLCEEFLRRASFIDLACRGEGEETAADLLGRLMAADGDVDDALDIATLAGTAAIQRGRFVSGPDRPRCTDLDSLPSPYLTGEFDQLVDAYPTVVTLETNRGCPYGCAFCDWGQATLQRIHQFSLERVCAELHWAADHAVPVVGIADANFGILPRDLDIAREVARISQKRGFPREFHMNNAKNATARVNEIVRVLREAGLVSQAVLSVQTRDLEVLATVQRKNIPPRRYDELLTAFRASNLPVHTEIMMGLPGSTYASFADDLQWAIDKELTAHVAWTMVLPNTPMADPSFRERYGIREIRESRLSDSRTLAELGVRPFPPNVIASTNTFDENDFLRMAQLSAIFHLFYGESILKYLLRFLDHDHGLRQVEVLERLRDHDLERYPRLRALRDWKVARLGGIDLLAGIVVQNGWPDLYQEVEGFVIDELGVASSSGLATALGVERSVKAWSGRQAPDKVAMAHDFVGYLEAARSGVSTLKLDQLPPGVLHVRDPARMCVPRSELPHYEPHCASFELDSELIPSRRGPLVPAADGRRP